MWARSPAQLHELMNLEGGDEEKEISGSHGSGRKDMTLVLKYT